MKDIYTVVLLQWKLKAYIALTNLNIFTGNKPITDLNVYLQF